MSEFENRINLNIPLEDLSKKVCHEYNLGEFINNKVIEIGYEDFNYILNTSTGKYVVKVFSCDRSLKAAKELTQRAETAYTNGVACPKMYKSRKGKTLSVLPLNNVKYRLLVMDYINGHNFFTLKQLPNNKELEIIATQLAKLNLIKYKPPFIYDKWAIVNFVEEYNKNISLVDEVDKPLIDQAYALFTSCDFKKLKYGFVHGDIIETNVIKDEAGKLYFIDFSVSNFLPRIVDLAVTICDLCLDLNDLETSKKRAELFINAYEKISPLSEYEKECLYKFIVCHQAITILETTREKKLENNQTEENEIFLQKGKSGLRAVINFKAKIDQSPNLNK